MHQSISNNVVHSRSAGGVVLNTDGKVLIVMQKNSKWSLPKGHIEFGEEKLQAAKREIYEESGVKELQLIKELGTYSRFKMDKKGENDKSEKKTLTFYLFTTTQMDVKLIDPHNPEARWVDRDDVVKYLSHQKDREFFESIKQELS